MDGSLTRPGRSARGAHIRAPLASAFLQTAFENGSPDEQLFLRHLALFLTSFFKAHGPLLEVEAYRSLLLAGASCGCRVRHRGPRTCLAPAHHTRAASLPPAGHNYLVGISDIDEPEIFKVALEYWLRLANDLYSLECSYAPTMPALGVPPSTYDAATGLMKAATVGGTPNPRKAVYAEVLSRVREVLIGHMAKPEEVLIEEDDSGEIVRGACSWRNAGDCSARGRRRGSQRRPPRRPPTRYPWPQRRPRTRTRSRCTRL